MNRSTVVLLALVFAGSCAPPADDGPPYIQAKPFDRARWLATTDGRGSMVDDLIARHLRPGTSRGEVAELLAIDIPPGATHARVEVGAMPNLIWGCCLELDFLADGTLIRAYGGGD